MKRKFPLPLVASHTAVILLGLLLAWKAVPAAPRDEEAETTTGSNTRTRLALEPAGRGTPRAPAAVPPVGKWHSSDYARAWKSVRNAGLTTKERLQVQRDLLERWAEVDLAAAIEAALGEAWDGGEGGPDYRGGDGPLVPFFSKAFQKNPRESWEILQVWQFGVASGHLRSYWIQAAGIEDPLFLAEKMGSLSWRETAAALSACRNGANSRPMEERLAIFNKLVALPESVVSTDMLGAFSMVLADPEASDRLVAEIRQMPEQDDRTARAKAALLGRIMSDLPPEQLAATTAGMSGTAGNELLWSALRSRHDFQRGLPLMDLLVERSAWDKMAAPEAGRQMQRMAQDGPEAARAVADWAADLPVRDETRELFHRSVDTFLRNNPDGAREWLATLPEGTWRDRALAEFSQQSLWARNDPAASQWALEQIGNADFKKVAGDWRSSWEKQRGGK